MIETVAAAEDLAAALRLPTHAGRSLVGDALEIRHRPAAQYQSFACLKSQALHGVP